MACKRLSMSREEFHAALQRASDSVASWPSIMAKGEKMSERLTDKELSDYAEHLEVSHEPGDIERRVVEELIERRAADRERETRIPIRIEFDYSSRHDSFGYYGTSKDECLKHIYVNMAAILFEVVDDPDIAWKALTAETILHELMHAIQEALGKLLNEDEVESALAQARGQTYQQINEDDPEPIRAYDSVVKRAELAERELAEIKRKHIEQEARQ